VYIQGIAANSVAAADGRLCRGDILLQVGLIDWPHGVLGARIESVAVCLLIFVGLFAGCGAGNAAQVTTPTQLTKLKLKNEGKTSRSYRPSAKRW